MVELHPEELRAAAFDAIAPFYDADLDRRVYEVERKWRRKADEALKAHPGYQDASDRITDAWERASDAAEELHDEQQQAAEILKDRVPPAPELPEAEPKGETKPPLFDSEVDFVTATRQLIRHKKLLGSDDGDLEENEEHIRDRGDES